MKKQMPSSQESFERVDEIDGRTGADIDVVTDNGPRAIDGQSRPISEGSSPSYEVCEAPIFLG